MAYNLTAISNTTNPLVFMQEANNLSNGVAGHGLLIVFGLFVLMIALAYTNHFGKSLLVAGLSGALISLIFVFAGLSSWYFPILFGVLIIVGIIMLQDKDYG